MEVLFAPASPAQEQFLTSDAKFTFYGGAAGAGKSFCLLMAFLKVCHHPRTRGAIFRKTTKMISNAGGLFDEAVNMYKQVDPKLKVRKQTLEIEFSSGALLKFGYLDGPQDKYNWQGAQLSWIGFDEIQQMTEDNVTYLISRLRSAYVDYPLQMYATGNPDYDSFIRHWVEFALDERGIPIRKENYPTRYFRKAGSKLHWTDTKEELEAIYGSGPKTGITSFKYIPGNIYDNPPLIEANPEYLSQLLTLDRVERERLLEGSWYARQEASGMFKRDWCSLVEHSDIEAKKRVRSWDIAFTEPSDQNKDPDWTRGVLMSKNEKTQMYTVEDVASIRGKPAKVEELIFSVAEHDGPGVLITIPQDPNAAAAAYARDLQARLAEKGFTVRLVKPVKSKLTRFAPFSSVAQAKRVNVVNNPDWNKDYFDELEVFSGNRKDKDDQVDATSDAFLTLNREKVMPTSLVFTNLSTPQKSTSFNFGIGSGTPVAFPLFKFG